MCLFFLKAYKDEEMFFQQSITAINEDRRLQPARKSLLFSLRSPAKNPLLSQGYAVRSSFAKTGKTDQIILGKETTSADIAVGVIETLRKNYPTLISASQVAVSRRKIFKISQPGQDGGCAAKLCEATVYQMLSNSCGMKVPAIHAVQLVCSLSRTRGLCKIYILAA